MFNFYFLKYFALIKIGCNKLQLVIKSKEMQILHVGFLLLYNRPILVYVKREREENLNDGFENVNSGYL